jgi:hypothetical protein
MVLVPPGVRRTVLLAIRPPAVLLPGLRRAWAVLASIRSPVLSGRRRAPFPPASILFYRTRARIRRAAAPSGCHRRGHSWLASYRESSR